MAVTGGKSLRTLLSENLRKSSVRGIPRILGAETAFVRLMWIVTVTCLFTGLAYNITNLVGHYRRGDTLINTKPWKSKDRMFPSVTVCNLNPFSITYDLKHHNLSTTMTPRLYRDIIAEMVRKALEKGTVTENEAEIFREYLLTMSSYYDNIDAHLRQHLQYYPLVLERTCKVYYRKNHNLQSRLCDLIEPIHIMGYFNCYRIKVQERKNEKIETVIVNALVNKEHDVGFCTKCIVENLDSLRTGMLVFLHPHAEYPVSIAEGLFVLPGTQNIIHIKQKKYMLAKDCSNKHPKHIRFHLNGKTYKSTYTKALCRTLASQNAIKSTCNCSSETLPHNVTDFPFAPGSMEYCYKQNLTSRVLRTDYLHCIADVEGKHHDYKELYDSKNECETPCIFEDFSVAHSSAKGISKNSALDIYRYYVREHMNASYHFTNLQPYEDALRERERNLTKVKEILATTDYMENSFMTLVLMYSESHAKILKENYLLDFASFISQVGGALTLFSGITLICIAEVLEILYDLIVFITGQCRGGSSNTWHTQISNNNKHTTEASDMNTMMQSFYPPRQTLDLDNL